MDAIEWLEKGYDELRDFQIRAHNGQQPVVGEHGLEYSRKFRRVRDPGFANMKDDHENAHDGGRCHKCSRGTLIVIE